MTAGSEVELILRAIFFFLLSVLAFEKLSKYCSIVFNAFFNNQKSLHKNDKLQ